MVNQCNNKMSTAVQRFDYLGSIEYSDATMKVMDKDGCQINMTLLKNPINIESLTVQTEVTHEVIKQKKTLEEKPKNTQSKIIVNSNSKILKRVEKNNRALKSRKQKVNEYMSNRNNALDNNISRQIRRNNLIVLLENTRITPFEWSKNQFMCFYCDEKFSNPNILRDHYWTTHQNITSVEIQKTLRKLKKHEVVKTDVTAIECKLCSELIKDLVNLKMHIKHCHLKDIDLEISDEILPFRFDQKDYQCAMCDESFLEFKTLNQHMNKHFQNFICDQCGTGFITPERLRMHKFSHGTGNFQCDACDKVFRSMIAKNEHYARVHMQVKRHRCPHCTETFKNYFQRNKHITSTHGLKIKEYKCNLCPKIFTTSGKLGQHIKSVHLKLKRYGCNMCDWEFYSKSELKDHITTHGGERKYQCDVCKKSYARKRSLRQHMRIHQDDRRFVCTVCGKSFIQNCSLKHHVKVHHPFSV